MSNHNRQMTNRVSGGSSNNTDRLSHCKGQASKRTEMIGNMLLWLFLFLLAGCSGLSNDEIITEKKKCDREGMKTNLLYNEMGFPMKVVCEPCEEEKARAKTLNTTNDLAYGMQEQTGNDARWRRRIASIAAGLNKEAGELIVNLGKSFIMTSRKKGL